MKTNILILAVLSSLSTGTFAQSSSPQSNSDIEVTAVVEAGCYLTADNINFGILQIPINDQSASSQMRIHCSKNAILDISLTYGDSSSSGGIYSAQPTTSGSNTWNIFENGKNIGQIACSYLSPSSQTYFYTNEVRQLVGSTDQLLTWVPDTYNLCSNEDYSQLNMSLISSLGGSGVLKGISSGEQIKFFIEKPTEANQIWSKNNSYSIASTGETQTIPMKANIKRADNATHRLTPDTYQSTLTVVLNY